jgi:hypothetical protein
MTHYNNTTQYKRTIPCILLSNEKKMAIYVYTNQRDGGIAHIPSQQEFVDLKSIMDGLSLTT